MNYYDELIDSIKRLIDSKDYEEALNLINNELKLGYIPLNIEEKLKEYLKTLKEATYSPKSLTEQDIEHYLFDSPEHQLLAVDELNKRNLREFIDLCEKFLVSNGYDNAKALLVDSLIKQEINYDFKYVSNKIKTTFNPSKLKSVEESDEFNETKKLLDEYYMKDPSKYEMGMQLLYKEALLTLPNKINSKDIYTKIINYIDDAFTK